jgi:hypothetical protein
MQPLKRKIDEKIKRVSNYITLKIFGNSKKNTGLSALLEELIRQILFSSKK